MTTSTQQPEIPNLNDLLDALRSATEALKDASEAMGIERRSRRIQFGGLLVGLIALAGCVWLAYDFSRDIQDQAESAEAQAQRIEAQADRIAEEAIEADVESCMAINQGRADLRRVLVSIVERGAPNRTPEEQAAVEDLLVELEQEVLPPLDCDAIRQGR